jgi:hypothetical protein
MGPVLFIILLKRAFSSLGNALRSVRSNSEGVNETELLLWGMGVMLVVHIVNWFGISYWDQTYVIWFMQLAAVSSLSEACIMSSEVQLQETVSEPEDFVEAGNFR